MDNLNLPYPRKIGMFYIKKYLFAYLFLMEFVSFSSDKAVPANRECGVYDIPTN